MKSATITWTSLLAAAFLLSACGGDPDIKGKCEDRKSCEDLSEAEKNLNCDSQVTEWEKQKEQAADAGCEAEFDASTDCIMDLDTCVASTEIAKQCGSKSLDFLSCLSKKK